MAKVLLVMVFIFNIMYANKTYMCNLTHINEYVPLSEREILGFGGVAQMKLSFDKMNANAEVNGSELDLKYYSSDRFGHDLYITNEQTDIIGISTPEGGKKLPGVFIHTMTASGELRLWYRCK